MRKLRDNTAISAAGDPHPKALALLGYWCDEQKRPNHSMAIWSGRKVLTTPMDALEERATHIHPLFCAVTTQAVPASTGFRLVDWSA